jgi:hypothetical protein
LGNIIGVRNINTSAVAELQASNTTLAGTERGLITRNIPGGTQAISAASLPLPTGAATDTLQTAGNASLTQIDTNTDPFLVAAAGGYIRQDSTFTIARETGGNLATVKTNTDPLVAAGAGGYVRQDSTFTIARESGGNLATAVASLSVLDDWDENDRAKVTTKFPLTVNAPAAATVGVASAQALASNASRKGAVFVNTSGNTISCAVGATAVLNSGITLLPGSVWNMDEYTYATGAVNCIAGAASSNLSIQEFQ